MDYLVYMAKSSILPTLVTLIRVPLQHHRILENAILSESLPHPFVSCDDRKRRHSKGKHSASLGPRTACTALPLSYTLVPGIMGSSAEYQSKRPTGNQ